MTIKVVVRSPEGRATHIALVKDHDFTSALSGSMHNKKLISFPYAKKMCEVSAVSVGLTNFNLSVPRSIMPGDSVSFPPGAISMLVG